MSKRFALLVALALAAPSMAFAGPYLGVGFGGTRTESSLTDLGLFPALMVPDPGNPGEEIPEYQGDDDFTSTDVAIDVTAGWMFTQHFGIEVGYTDFGSAEQRYKLPDACNSRGCQNREWTAEMDMTGWRAFVVGSLPINESFDAFVKLGAISWDAEYRGFERNAIFTPGEPPLPERNDSIRFDGDDTGLAAGLGINLKTDSQFSVRAEVNYYDVDTTDIVWNAGLMAVYTF